MKEKPRLLSVVGQLASAYELYRYQPEKITEAKNLAEKVMASIPPCTNFHKARVGFKAVLDHILYNKDKVEVVALLETPTEE